MSGKYRTIVADPPWDVKAGPRSLHDKNESSRPLEYPTMTLEQMRGVPVSDMAAQSAHLYLWTINKYIPDAYWLAREWGFSPSTMLVWVKKPKGRGLGGTFGISTEYVLFCRRGSLPANSHVESTWFQWPRGPHSAKPEAFLDLVEQVSPGPYLEMFARRNRLGWDTWGNECLQHVDVTHTEGV